jgi:hypothetical protein
MKRTITTSLFAAAVFAFIIATVPQASAGVDGLPDPSKLILKDFYTAALDADGCFKDIWCTEAKLGYKDGVAKESYKCVFQDNGLGPAALPAEGMTWDYYNSANLTGVGCSTGPYPGPYRWYSDIENFYYPGLGVGGDLCWMYTSDKGQPPAGKSNFEMKIGPDGKVNVKVVYDPPVFGMPDGSPCP